MTKEEIIDNLELYTVGRPKKDQVSIIVEKLQNLIDEIKALEQNTSDDYMSREEVKNKAIQLWNGDGDEDYKFSTLIDYITGLEPVTPTQRWIPVSERLPEDRNIVLVTAYWHGTYQVMMASYFGEGLWWCVPFNNCGDHMQKLNPKAWQPLPKPYEERQGSEK